MSSLESSLVVEQVNVFLLYLTGCNLTYQGGICYGVGKSLFSIWADRHGVILFLNAHDSEVTTRCAHSTLSLVEDSIPATAYRQMDTIKSRC